MLGGQQRAAHGLVLPVDDAAVLQHIAADAAGDIRAVHPRQRTHGIAGQNVIGVVDALERQLDAVPAVDGEEAGIQIRVGDGIGRLRPVKIAFRAVVRADVVVVVVVVGHGRVAQRAVFSVVVDAGAVIGGEALAIHAEPDHPVLPSPGEQRHQRVVGVEDQRAVRADAGLDGLEHPLGVAVAGELVAVQVGDDVVGGLEIAEGVLGVALIGLDDHRVALTPSCQGAAAQQHGGDALDLVGALPVEHHLFSGGGEHMGDHLGRGGLAVAAGNGDDLRRKLHPLQNVGTDLQRDLSGQAAAPPHKGTDKAYELADQNGQKFSHGNPPYRVARQCAALTLQSYPRWDWSQIISAPMSAGDTPEMRLACPRFRGRTALSFSRASKRSP